MKVPFLDSCPSRAPRPAGARPALAALAATYDANRFCLGKDVDDFERGLGAVPGVSCAVLGMNSGTASLHVACMIAGFACDDGGRHVVSFTAIASRLGASAMRLSDAGLRRHRGGDVPRVSTPAKLEGRHHPEDREGFVIVHLRPQAGAHGRDHGPLARRHDLLCDRGLRPGRRRPLAAARRWAARWATAARSAPTPRRTWAAAGSGGAFVSRDEAIQVKARQIRVHGS